MKIIAKDKEILYQFFIYIFILAIVSIHFLFFSLLSTTASDIDILSNQLIFLIIAVIISTYRAFGLISVYGLFMLTTTLFICGRVISSSYLDLDPFNSPVNSSFYPSQSDKALTLYFIVFSYICLHLGALLAQLIFPNLRLKNHKFELDFFYKDRKFIQLLFLAISFIYIVLCVYNIKNAVSNGGYLTLYAFQAESYSTSFDAIILVSFQIVLSLYFISSDNKNNKVAMAVLLIIGLTFFIIGQRGKLIASILFLLWYWHTYIRKVSFLQIFTVFMFVVFLSQFIIIFTIRGASSVNAELFDPFLLLALFLYQQGVSLSVFELSFQITDWPILPYVQSIIPGITAMLNLIGFNFETYETSFGGYLAYTVNPNAYLKGNALGWTLLGDLNLYSGSHPVIFIVFSILVGYSLRYIELLSKTNPLVRGVIFMTFQGIMMAPRGGIGAVIPYALYFCIIYFLYTKVSKLYFQRKIVA